jgi:hypothetical protein
VTGDSVDEAFLLVCKAVLEKRHRAQQQGYGNSNVDSSSSSANSGDIGAQLDATTKLINRVSFCSRTTAAILTAINLVRV